MGTERKLTSNTPVPAGISSNWMIRMRRSTKEGVSMCDKIRLMTFGCDRMKASI
jgi:hypothetical protein